MCKWQLEQLIPCAAESRQILSNISIKHGRHFSLGLADSVHSNFTFLSGRACDRAESIAGRNRIDAIVRPGNTVADFDEMSTMAELMAANLRAICSICAEGEHGGRRLAYGISLLNQFKRYERAPGSDGLTYRIGLLEQV